MKRQELIDKINLIKKERVLFDALTNAVIKSCKQRTNSRDIAEMIINLNDNYLIDTVIMLAQEAEENLNYRKDSAYEIDFSNLVNSINDAYARGLK